MLGSEKRARESLFSVFGSHDARIENRTREREREEGKESTALSLRCQGQALPTGRTMATARCFPFQRMALATGGQAWPPRAAATERHPSIRGPCAEQLRPHSVHRSRESTSEAAPHLPQYSQAGPKNQWLHVSLPIPGMGPACSSSLLFLNARAAPSAKRSNAQTRAPTARTTGRPAQLCQRPTHASTGR